MPIFDCLCLGLVSQSDFVYDFLRKLFLMIAFASSDIGQYVYGNYLVSSL